MKAAHAAQKAREEQYNAGELGGLVVAQSAQSAGHYRRVAEQESGLEGRRDALQDRAVERERN